MNNTAFAYQKGSNPAASATFVKSSNHVPELSKFIQLDSQIATSAGHWIDDYLDYSQTISPMTPKLFHESAALWLASVAIARRLVLGMPFGDVYPNLYFLWVAPSTLFRKTTAMEIPRKLASNIFPFLLASNDTTPEAMFSDMAGKEPAYLDKMTDKEKKDWEQERDYCAQRGWIQDEFSGLLAGMGRDYNAGLLEALLRFYDCSPLYTRSTRLQGRIQIRDAYFSILGASTHSALACYFGIERLWTNGFWPRFAILTPEVDRPAWVDVRDNKPPTVFVDGLQTLFDKLPKTTWPNPPQALSVSLGIGVMDIYQTYSKAVSYEMLTPDLDSRLYASYGRLPTLCLKVAMILATLDWTTSRVPTIELPHITRAIQITDEWRISVHRALSQVVDDEFDQIGRRLMSLLGKYPTTGMTFRDICRDMRDRNSSQIQNALDELIVLGDVLIAPKGPGPNGGRPTIVYTIP
jgi:hypothetical protein